MVYSIFLWNYEQVQAVKLCETVGTDGSMSFLFRDWCKAEEGEGGEEKMVGEGWEIPIINFLNLM